MRIGIFEPHKTLYSIGFSLQWIFFVACRPMTSYFFSKSFQRFSTLNFGVNTLLSLLELGDSIYLFGPTQKFAVWYIWWGKNYGFFFCFIYFSLSYIYLRDGEWVFKDLYSSRLILSPFIPIFDIMDYSSHLLMIFLV